MQTLLVTIQGPQHTIDLELPGDVPIRELLPTIIMLCGPSHPTPLQQHPGAWGLGVLDAYAPLPVASSLTSENVVNGAILKLQELPAWAKRRRQKGTFKPKTIQPGPASGGVGVRWSKEELRIR